MVYVPGGYGVSRGNDYEVCPARVRCMNRLPFRVAGVVNSRLINEAPPLLSRGAPQHFDSRCHRPALTALEHSQVYQL